MRVYFLKRLLASLFSVLGVVSVVFFLIHWVPGDPIDLMLGDTAQLADKDALRRSLGLDEPLLVQYLNFWRHVLDGSWGQSITYQTTVMKLILQNFFATALLTLTSVFIAVGLSLPLGVFSAKKAGTMWDRIASLFAMLCMSLPVFVLAPLAILFFSIHLRWLPVAGFRGWEHLILPSLCLGLGLCGFLARMVRTSVLENLNEDFVRTARSKGLSERVVLFKHTLKNALIPILTVAVGMLGSLLGGAVITETIFDWPGLGKLFYSAFQARDYPLVQGVVLWLALSYIAIHFILDILYIIVDPRIRLESQK